MTRPGIARPPQLGNALSSPFLDPYPVVKSLGALCMMGLEEQVYVEANQTSGAIPAIDEALLGGFVA